MNLCDNKPMKIGALAKLLGVHRDTIRRWEKAGYIQSQRHPFNNYRLYSNEEIKRVLKTVLEQL